MCFNPTLAILVCTEEHKTLPSLRVRDLYSGWRTQPACHTLLAKSIPSTLPFLATAPSSSSNPQQLLESAPPEAYYLQGDFLLLAAHGSAKTEAPLGWPPHTPAAQISQPTSDRPTPPSIL